MTTEIKNRNCYLYVLNTLADWEIGYITAELHSNRYVPKKQQFKVVPVGSDRKEIRTMGGIPITPQLAFEEVGFKEGDLLLLPGADTWMDGGHKELFGMIPALLNKGVTVAAICGATFALAHAGLFEGRKHTSNSKELLGMICPGYKGHELYVDSPAAADGSLVTAGGMAPLEFAYEVFKSTGAMNEAALEAWYQLNRTREANYYYRLMESLD